MATWDPAQYAQFADERGRPFRELVARIPTQDPVAVVDLGCGPGSMTATLAERWPHAAILGIDSSEDMIEAAAKHRTAQVTFRKADIAGWRPEKQSVDVIVSNAALHWVPGHIDLLPGWAAALDEGGALALQVPLTFGAPAGAAITGVAADGPWASVLEPVLRATRSPVQAPETYMDVLAGAGLRVDVWSTTFFHVLQGVDPVLEWFSGTGLRTYLDALAGEPALLDGFRQQIAARFREEFPSRDYGTVLPFPRLFVVATAT
jgi:trans-aconitate 2-methyltransferase